MLVLGIDPGIATTGYGLVDWHPAGLSLITYGTIKTKAKIPKADRLLELYLGIRELVAGYSPALCAMEQLFFNSNTRTAMTVGEARGVITLAVRQAEIPLYEYTPLQVKQAVTGYGRATKQQIKRMVAVILNMSSEPNPDDAADALAISICHTQHYLLNALNPSKGV